MFAETPAARNMDLPTVTYFCLFIHKHQPRLADMWHSWKIQVFFSCLSRLPKPDTPGAPVWWSRTSYARYSSVFASPPGRWGPEVAGCRDSSRTSLGIHSYPNLRYDAWTQCGSARGIGGSERRNEPYPWGLIIEPTDSYNFKFVFVETC